MNSINKNKIILASKSPRRKELLEQIGLDITICPSNIDENKVPIQEPEKYVKELACMKAHDVSHLYPDSWVIGADTIVVIQDKIIEKPDSKADAVKMLNQLNNCEHFVYTAFCICNKNKSLKNIQSVKTKVYFKHLTAHEINWYTNTQEPFDKAGGYGIQGIGSFIVKSISGSYTNVVGLPVCEIVEALLKLNLIEFKDLKPS
jgi:septum formation protein